MFEFVFNLWTISNDFGILWKSLEIIMNNKLWEMENKWIFTRNQYGSAIQNVDPEPLFEKQCLTVFTCGRNWICDWQKPRFMGMNFAGKSALTPAGLPCRPSASLVYLLSFIEWCCVIPPLPQWRRNRHPLLIGVWPLEQYRRYVSSPWLTPQAEKKMAGTARQNV